MVTLSCPSSNGAILWALRFSKNPIPSQVGEGFSEVSSSPTKPWPLALPPQVQNWPLLLPNHWKSLWTTVNQNSEIWVLVLHH